EDGLTVDWTALIPEAAPVDLPTYPFQHQRYWPTSLPAASAANPAEAAFWAAVAGEDVEALGEALGQPVDSAWGEVLPVLSAWRREQREQEALDELSYRTTWQSLTPPAASPTGRWLLLTPGFGHEPLADELRARGAEVETLAFAPGSAGREEMAAEFRCLGDLRGVVSLLALDTSAHPDAPGLTTGFAATVAAVQALGDAGVEAPFWCLTTGAVAVPGDGVPTQEGTLIWGFGRSAALEAPARWGGLLDLPTEPGPADWTRTVSLLGDSGGEDQLAVRGRGVFVRRLERAPMSRAVGWHPRGTVLVTGGTGALGRQVARWLASGGATHVILTSRGGPNTPGVDDVVAELGEQGVRVSVVACDITDRQAVDDLLDLAGPDLTAVVHAAGAGEFRPLAEATTELLSGVVAAKVLGARHLDEALADRDLDAFVLFSSIAATWGSGGQPGYAAANAVLDTIALARRARGLRATSVAWGPWDGDGLASGEAGDQLRRRGLPPMAPTTGTSALGRVAGEEQSATAVIVDVDWEKFAQSFTLLRPSPLLTGVPEAVVVAGAVETTDTEGTADRLRAQLAPLDDGAQLALIRDLVVTQVAAVLGHADARSVEADRDFLGLGFDSLTAVELRNALNAVTGLTLPATLAFDHPSPGETTRFIHEQLMIDTASSDASLFDQLDRLEAAVGALPVDRSDDLTRTRISLRLQNLLSQLATQRTDDDGAVDDLAAATDDELFELVERDLGLS
ncbi:SDR family NAD(P)-dependent oxidoreductase, partial [Streptomyces humidus]|uniref:SDR family NAD(P)-dependent oxidoreductase n=1 Tax=Streptomyces humidus TaxID=52259 RepID=UPI00167DFEAD